MLSNVITFIVRIWIYKIFSNLVTVYLLIKLKLYLRALANVEVAFQCVTN